jgi:branched-chain amino acid transport system substrate-binding protein
MQTIGILLPRSTYYESIGFDLFQGLKLGLTEIDNKDIRVVTENIGFGAEKQQCYRSAEKLLLEENASIVIAYIGQRGAQLLRPLFLAMNRILIVLDAGANLPHEADFCPNIIYHSFHNSLGTWLSSKMAIRDGFSNGGMVTGYYDGGYLHTVALTEGFVRNEGKIQFNIATGFKPETFSMNELVQHRKNHPESAVLSLFSGDFVQWYFNELIQHYGVSDIPVYLSPFGLEEQMIENANYPGPNVKGITAWSKHLDSEENKYFLTSVEKNLNKIPSIFLLMGWEAALLVDTIINLQTTLDIKGVSAELLRSISFKSPRGQINMFEAINTTYAPMYEASIISTENNTCSIQIDAVIEHTLEHLNEITTIQLNNSETAWYNSYVCI